MEGEEMATVGKQRREKPRQTSARHAGGRPRAVPVCEWGQRVEAIMRQRGMTRKDLADKAGIKPPSLWALLVGNSEPKFQTVCAIADALSVPVTRLR
jgi:DNA-binding XRE family transcriptional regulator